MAKNRTALRLPHHSSLAATRPRAPSAGPRNTASVVSKLLPQVWTLTTPLCGAVHRYHTEAAAGPDLRTGSPASAVAQRLLPEADAVDPLPRSSAFAKSSFGGMAASAAAGNAATPTDTNSTRKHRGTCIRLTELM